MNLILACVLALFWGMIWAILLQVTPIGRYLVRRRTWLTVVIGVGIDLFIILLIVPISVWLQIVAIFAASSITIIARSLWNEWQELDEQIAEAISGNAHKTR